MIELTDSEFNDLVSFVKVNFGLDLANKKTFAQMRLQKLIDESSYDNFKDYFNYVCTDISGIAVANFVSSLTVNYTLFFRESYHFEYFASDILPALYLKEQASRDLRIWSAGCSTGEEPYTLAILISDFLGINRPFWDMQILATDISTFALKKALVGSYPASSMGNLSEDWKKKYFAPDINDPDNLLISEDIKNQVIFRKHNMVKDPFNFKQKFHVIFCRNVMIYFDEPTKYQVVKRFYDCLADGGYLFIGLSETLDASLTDFEYVLPSVYQKKKG